IGKHTCPTGHPAVVPVFPVQMVPVAVPPQRFANVPGATFLQKPQKTFDWFVRSTAVLDTVPELSTKAIGSAPRRVDDEGGQSWLVGKSPSMAPSPGVQAKPSLMPASHLPETQVGQG